MPRQARRSSQFDLVSFDRPPVAEVALSVQFAPDTVDLEALGQFAREVREDLPVRERQPVVPAMAETFDIVPIPQSIEIHLEAPATWPRTWFQSADAVQLVQLQHDRLTLNWREPDYDVDYPRYAALRERFQYLLTLLSSSLEEIGPPLVINLCEVTYVNPIEYAPGPPESGHPDLAHIINRVRPRPPGAFLPEAEDAQIQARWRIPAGETGEEEAPAAGRLHLSAAPGLKPPKNTPIYLVNLTARVLPRVGDLAGAMAALDVAHKWVVLGFKDLTTSQMHRKWGLKETRA